MRIAVPDLVSPSYFPAIAAVELGFARREGVDVELELRYPVTSAVADLRDGEIDFLAGAAHSPAYLDDGWDRIKLLLGLSRNMYWFLVVRTDLGVARGDLRALRDVRIGAAPGPDLGLVEMLAAAGVDRDRANVEVVPVPAAVPSSSFGVVAAEALRTGQIDAFWANGMGAEVAVRGGYGTVLVDARRGDGPPGSTGYTFPALMTSERLLAGHGDSVAAVMRAVRYAQAALAKQPELAETVGERLFPPLEASLIAGLVARDASFYDPEIAPPAVESMLAFASRRGLNVADPSSVLIHVPEGWL